VAQESNTVFQPSAQEIRDFAGGGGGVPNSPPTSFSGWEPKRLWHATPDGGAYEECAFAEGFDSRADGRALIAADLDNDGDLDLVMLNRAHPRLQLFENVGGEGNAVEIVPGPKPDGVQVFAEGLGLFTAAHNRGFASSVPPWIHLGLGARKSVNVEVRWRDGKREKHTLEAGARYEIRQGKAPTATRFWPNRSELARPWPATLEVLGLPKQKTVVQLFTRGCKPCAEEAPLLAKRKDVVAMGIIANLDNVDAAAKSLGITYPAHELPDEVADALGHNGALTLPLLLVYGADGKLERVVTDPKYLD
jgi:hypothetical protein